MSMGIPFIRKRVPQACHAPLEEWQPAFFDPRGKLCPMLPSAGHAVRYLDFLEHRIARRPTDLLAHVRRILVARAYRQDKLIPDALQDLSRVLGDKGMGLRAHLLALCAPMLDAATVQMLRSHPISSKTAFPAIVSRSTDREMTLSRASAGNASLLTEALACLEDGDVIEARKLLERHVVAFPKDVEATRLLLDIYLRARDSKALAALRQRLEPLPEQVRPLWDATAASLVKRV